MPYNTIPSFYVQPLNGGTVNVPTFDGPLLNVLLDPATAILALTINLPTAAADGQIVRIATSQTITTTSLISGLGAILGAVSTMLGNGGATAYTWSAIAGKWFRS